MMPPTSIDGTDITGATIDGTDVTEITVDGQTVFSAQTDPVAYSDLVAWYPFDPSFYGGSNADDVTAILGGSGNDTAFDGTVTGGTHQSSGGVTDINTGASSGVFDFNGPPDGIEFTNSPTNAFNGSFTMMAWSQTRGPSEKIVLSINDEAFTAYVAIKDTQLQTGNGKITFTVSSNTWFHVAAAYNTSSSSYDFFLDGNNIGNISAPQPNASGNELYIGKYYDGRDEYDGLIDDVRIYNTDLSSTQINQIYQNTEP